MTWIEPSKINLPQAAIPALEDLLRQERDAERDRAADWLEAHEFDMEIHQAPKSLRANEHRSESNG